MKRKNKKSVKDFYYGTDASKYIITERNELCNNNGFFLGTPGSGKGFQCRSEIELTDPKDMLKCTKCSGVYLKGSDRYNENLLCEKCRQELLKIKDKPFGKAICYGQNAVTGEDVWFDRLSLSSPHGVFIGGAGSGKSFLAKTEIVNVFTRTHDNIVICGGRGEYAALTKHLNGQVIDLFADDGNFINPFDINVSLCKDEYRADGIIDTKISFFLALCEQLMPDNNKKLTNTEKGIIHRCLRLVYEPLLQNPDNTEMPIVEDLYNVILQQTESEAQILAENLEIFIKGSLKKFNNRTNVKLDNRLICFEIPFFNPLATLIAQDTAWNIINENSCKRISTRYYIEEISTIMKNEFSAYYFNQIYKRSRKLGGILTLIIQQTIFDNDILKSIICNTQFVLLFRIGNRDIKYVAELFNIKEQKLESIIANENYCNRGFILLPTDDDNKIFVNNCHPSDTEFFKILS